MEGQEAPPAPPLPRITIQFCTQCKWMLRAAYFAQELLSTFSTSLGEVALQPSTGGTFKVHLYHATPSLEDVPSENAGAPPFIQEYLLWDRKAEGGFPETKELKKRVRNIIDPGRDLGHVDGKKSTPTNTPDATSNQPTTAEQYNLPVTSNEAIPSPAAPETYMAGVPIPRAINRLQSNASVGGVSASGNRKFTPMDVDTEILGDAASRSASGNGKIKVEGQQEGGACRPGDDCWEG